MKQKILIFKIFIGIYFVFQLTLTLIAFFYILTSAIDFLINNARKDNNQNITPAPQLTIEITPTIKPTTDNMPIGDGLRQKYFNEDSGDIEWAIIEKDLKINFIEPKELNNEFEIYRESLDYSYLIESDNAAYDIDEIGEFFEIGKVTQGELSIRILRDGKYVRESKDFSDYKLIIGFYENIYTNRFLYSQSDSKIYTLEPISVYNDFELDNQSIYDDNVWVYQIDYYKLKLFTPLYNYDYNDELKSEKGITFSSFYPNSIFYSEIKSEVEVDKISGTSIYKGLYENKWIVYSKNFDNTIMTLNYHSFILSDDIEIDSGVPKILWNNGGKPTKSYFATRAETSCLSFEIDYINNPLSDFVITGKDDNGNSVYEYKNTNDQYLKLLYAAAIEYENNKEMTYNQFIATHPVFFWKNEYDLLIRYTREDYFDQLIYSSCNI